MRLGTRNVRKNEGLDKWINKLMKERKKIFRKYEKEKEAIHYLRI